MTLKASSHSVNFPDLTTLTVSGNLEDILLELPQVEVLQLGILALSVGSSVSGLYLELAGGYSLNAIGGFEVPIASVGGGASVSGPNILLATSSSVGVYSTVLIENPPPFIKIQPYAAAWPSPANGSFLRIAAAWR